MQIEALEYLLAMADEGSTRKAAESLNTSYQNVSRVLLQMEEQWQVKLFQRGSKGMQATEEGELAIATAREMLRIYQQMLEQFRYRTSESNERVAGQLELGASLVANNAFVNDLLVDFSGQYPRIQVTLAEEDAYLPDGQQAHRLFLVPRMATELQEEGCEIIPLLKDEMALLVKKDNALIRQKSISLARLVKLPLVLVYRNCWEASIFGRIFQASGVALEKPTSTGNVIGFQKYVATGEYVGLVTAITAHKLLSGGNNLFEVLPIRDKAIDFYYCLIIRDGEQLSCCEQAFVKFVKESFHISH